MIRVGDGRARRAEIGRLCPVSLAIHETCILRITTGVVNTAVLEAEGVQERVAVEEMQRLVARLRQHALRGAVAVERSENFARDLAFDLGQRVLMLVRARQPDLVPGEKFRRRIVDAGL